jgi:hypothetical protein
MSQSCDVEEQAAGDGRGSSNLPWGPLSMVVVSGRRPLQNYTLVRFVGLAELAGLVGLVALVAGQSESKTPGTIAEAGSLRWVSGCNLVHCTCMMAHTV